VRAEVMGLRLKFTACVRYIAKIAWLSNDVHVVHRLDLKDAQGA